LHEKGCPWDERTCAESARYGHLDCLKYAHENRCPWDKRTCAYAAESGHIDCLKYAHENRCPWDERTCAFAAKNGNLDCLRYAHEKRCPCEHLNKTKIKKHDVALDVPAPSSDNDTVDACAICFVNLLKVQYKPCNHRFCIMCTNKLIDAAGAENKKFTCAMCRTDVEENVLLDN
jgi:hypothetical protein